MVKALQVDDWDPCVITRFVNLLSREPYIS